MIRAGVGLSTERGIEQAAEDAVARAAEGLEGQRPDWCVVFATAEHAPGMPRLLGALAEAAGTPYVVGCSAAGVVVGDAEVEEGPAVGVLAVSSDTIRSTPFLFHDDGDHGLTAGIRIGQRLMGSRGTGDLVVVWPDPFHVSGDRLLEGLDATLQGVPVVGGAASSRGGKETTIQFCGAEVSGGAVSGMRLGGEFRHQVAITQGCRPISEPLLVTRSHENLILEVEGEPAVEALRARAPAEMFDDPIRILEDLFVGILPDVEGETIRPGDYLVRNIVAADPDTGILAIADHVEEGQSILFAVREPHAARHDLARMTERVRSGRGDLEYRFGFYFNCLGRGSALYGRRGVDAAHLTAAFPGVPLLGFFSNAEIAPMRGVHHVLTYTGVLVLVGE